MSEAEGTAGQAAAECELTIEGGRLHVRLAGERQATPANIVYLRPLSARSEIAFFDDDSNELLWLESVQQLAPDCRAIAETQLAQRYHLPCISRVLSIETVFGSHYWHVQTDKGSREFALKEPGKHVTYLGDDHIILRDTIGNRYEIRELSGLDAHSQRQVNKIL